MKSMKKKMEGYCEEDGGEVGRKREGKGIWKKMEKRVGEIERKWEAMEKGDRRKNIAIRGQEVKKGKKREGAKKLLKERDRGKGKDNKD